MYADVGVVSVGGCRRFSVGVVSVGAGRSFSVDGCRRD